MQQCYGIDVERPGLLERRTARWLQARVEGLLSTDSRIYRALGGDG